MELNGTQFTRKSRIQSLLKISTNMQKLLTECASETLGTALLLFLGCMGCHTNPEWGDLIFGMAVMTVIQCLGHISGAHVNPAVSLCAYLLDKISFLQCLLFSLSQLLGAYLGFGLLHQILPLKTDFCLTRPTYQLNVFQSLSIEYVITMVLILICCSVWDHANAKNQDSVSIKFGIVIALLSLSASKYTGASMNPARSFGPALINNNWADHWIYWVAPMLSSLVTTLLYKHVFMTKSFMINTQFDLEQK